MTGLIGFAAVSVPILEGWTDRRSKPDLEPADLNDILGRDEVARIGAHAPIEEAWQDGDRLAAELATAGPGKADARPTEWDADSLRDIVKSEFRAGRIAIVNGWVLSRTEVRQCRLQARRID